MFNVNSTSATAWRALLGHARIQWIAYMDGNGNPKLSGNTDHAISRFSVAGEAVTCGSGSSCEMSGAADSPRFRPAPGRFPR